jgi:hypothetical protein
MRHRKIVSLTAAIYWLTIISIRAQQINIPRVDNMPSLPTTLLIRDWAVVARQYDSLVYDVTRTGSDWPLVTLGASGINYPGIRPIFMDSYVGSAFHGSQAEAINIIPSLVGASLVGIDKSNQFGANWVESAADFFNKRNGQNVYLNNSSGNSGSDWWYDIMPNVFFYQLYSLYPAATNFETQFVSVADVWQGAVRKMGGSATPWKVPVMNYRAWNLSTDQPLASGVIEPEAAGSLSWLLYNAYIKKGNKDYLQTAQMCMDFLNSLNSNPSYEIQLPYGVLTAARMNAELGSAYDVEKMLNWVFNRGPLRGWGNIIGTWNGNSVSGLVGEANDAGDDYAFIMNGFQQAAALVPLVKYDKRFARAIGKWMVNVANASRLFYTSYIPADHQDSYAWSTANDPNSVIAHESLKQIWNNFPLFARGDAILGGWASTDLALYSSSHVGYLGAIVHKTNIDGVLSLDLNKTDFYGNSTFPRFLIYNPYTTAKSITITLGPGNFDIYDAINEKVILSGVTGNTTVTIGADSARLLVYLPGGATLTQKNGNLYSANTVVDYHYHYDFSGRFRIKSLAVQKSRILINSKDTAYCYVENATAPVLYTWALNGHTIYSGTNNILNWNSPAVEGLYKLSCSVTSDSLNQSDTLVIEVDSLIPEKPHITGLHANKTFYFVNDSADLNISVTDINGSPLSYKWSADSGAFLRSDAEIAVWTAPASAGIYAVKCHIENIFGLSADTSVNVLVKSGLGTPENPLVYYPFDGDVKDYSGNGFNAILSGPQLTTDALGEPQRAYHFSSSSDIIYTPNQTALNFQNAITLSFWLKLDQVPEECYVISHGSWEERYKVSVTPERKLRWSIKTDQGTRDLDNSTALTLNTFYHFTVAYTGYSMEIYVNGNLDVFMALSGKIQQTSKDLTIGHKDRSTNSYFLRGTIDEVKIFDHELPVSQIKLLPTLWNQYTSVGLPFGSSFTIYPNPADQSVFINSGPDEPTLSIEAFDMMGRKLDMVSSQIDPKTYFLQMINPIHGLVVIRVVYKGGESTGRVIFR